jgi:hypothetical protein
MERLCSYPTDSLSPGSFSMTVSSIGSISRGDKELEEGTAAIYVARCQRLRGFPGTGDLGLG